MQCEWPTMLKNYIVNGVGSYVKEALTNTMNAAKGTVFYELFEKSKNKVGSKVDSSQYSPRSD